MLRQSRLFPATVLLCLLGALAIAIIQMLDKTGRIRPQFGGHIVVLVSPLLAVAAAAGWWRPHRWLPVAALGVAVCCGGISLWGNLGDYIAWSQTPPGQEVMHFGAFLAMLGSWLMVIGLVVAGAVSWIMRRRSGRRSGGEVSEILIALIALITLPSF
jgi:hypothetical protein